MIISKRSSNYLKKIEQTLLTYFYRQIKYRNIQNIELAVSGIFYIFTAKSKLWKIS